MTRRLSTCLLAVFVALAYATAGEHRAVAATASWSGDAPINDEALGHVVRVAACPGRPGRSIDPPARVRLSVAALPAQPCVASLAPGSFAAPSPIARHLAGHLSRSGRTSRGPPRHPIA